MADLPPLPAGFTLDSPGGRSSAGLPPLPAGFTLDGAAPPESASRIAGLGANAALSGIGDVANAPQNILALADRAAIGIRARVRALMGMPPENLAPITPNATGPDTGDTLGLPTPQGKGESLYSAAVRAGTGAALTGGAAGVNALRTGAAGVTGGAASEGARQMGAGPVGQFVAGAVGGAVPSAVGSVARFGARAIANAARPLTSSGQTDIAAATMQSQASDPRAAAANLDNAQEIIPGSPRTMGEASKDTGLLALEKGVRGKNTADFADRLSQQNNARQQALQGIAGTEADVSAAQAARNAQTGSMREAALSSGGTADVSPIVASIDETLKGPIGKRDIASQALTWLKGKLSDGSDGLETDPAKLYAIRQDVNDAIAGKLGGDQAKFRLASGQLIQVRGQLDDAIEAAAPGFKAYLQRYSDLSKPIDQMKVMQEIQKRANLTSADVTTGQPFMGSAGFSRALDNALQEEKLTPTQITQLKAIKTDLQMGQAINGPLVKAPGSDTFQNLSIAQVIGAGPKVMGALAKPLNWLYKTGGTDKGVNEILKNAALDPKFAAALLRRATPQSTYQLSEALKRLGTSAAVGGAAGIPRQLQPSQTVQTTSGVSP